MSNLNIDKKNIKTLFQDRRADFLIPDYQRPYTWDTTQCQTLWNDIFAFAIPDNGSAVFDQNSEYFLGPIVTFKNDHSKMEIIDGQQRLTTLMLLLRAFYAKFGHMQDNASVTTRQNIEQCIWKTDEFGNPDKSALKIDSEVATDEDKGEFLSILKTGDTSSEQKSQYALNYRFFQGCIDVFLNQYPTYFAYLPTRIMNNCILLPIEAESQDTALRIFSTLNDRGQPLSDSDIFKAQFYKFYTQQNKKDAFIETWKALEASVNKIFHPKTGTPMDELFTRYMYYARAKNGVTSTTTEALRKFYEQNCYAILRNETTLNELTVLSKFWQDISIQNDERFSQSTLKKLFTLNYAPNGMWTYFVSVYFLHYRDENDQLDENVFNTFLDKTIGFIWTSTVINPGVNALRMPIYQEMVNIIKNIPVLFNRFRFNRGEVLNAFNHYAFNNGRPITKSILAWWIYQNNEQPLLSLETTFEIEHIYARKRFENDNTFNNANNLDALGNKTLLEKRINIRAADYRFIDKKKYYTGFTNGKGQQKEGSQNHELLVLSGNNDFVEADIEARTQNILHSFIDFLAKNNLLE